MEINDFNIKIDQDAINDIKEAFDWYESQQSGIGQQFLTLLAEQVNQLKSNPFFQVKYSNVRCVPVKSFPFMIHFTLDEANKLVVIRAIFSTHRDPQIWKKRKV